MSKIFIVHADGSKTVVTQSQLKEFAASGRIQRDTILEANEKTARATDIRELAAIFDARDAGGAASVVAPPPLAPPSATPTPPRSTVGAPPPPLTPSPHPTVGTAPPPLTSAPPSRSGAPFPNARAVVPPPLESDADGAPSVTRDDSRAAVAAADLGMEVSDLFTTYQVRVIAGRRVARTMKALDWTLFLFYAAWIIACAPTVVIWFAALGGASFAFLSEMKDFAGDGILAIVICGIIVFVVVNLPFVFLHGFIRAVRDNTEYRAEDAVRQELYLAEILKRSK